MTGLPWAFLAAQELGRKSILRYARYQALLHSGVMRWRTPVFEWAERPLRFWLGRAFSADPLQFLEHRRGWEAGGFFFAPSVSSPQLRRELQRSPAEVRKAADEILEGKFRLFGGKPRDLGQIPDWQADSGIARNTHWSEIDPEDFEDIRLSWEPARFGFVFPLARAYRLDSDAKYFHAFWRLLESWCVAWPANAGPHWVSGQEVGIRLLGMVFAWFAFAPEFDRAPDKAAHLAAVIAAHAARIPSSLSYAWAQGNNHLLSEAAAIFTAGVVFPEFAASGRWRTLGRSTFLKGLAEQVLKDGGYVQHSSRYHRLALDLATWCARLGQIHGLSFPDSTRRDLSALTECLAGLVDPGSGVACNLGHNDGTVLLPLTSLSGADYRPSLQAASILFRGSAMFSAGPWDELAAWLGLPPQPEAAAEAAAAYPEAGIHILTGQKARGVLRCARFRTRPAHSDQLHLDIWVKGNYLIRDPGSYRYKAPPPWDNSLAAARLHNGPVVDGTEPMWRKGRFLWVHWAQGRVLGRWRSRNATLEAISVEHNGYRDLGITVRRTVIRGGDEGWLVSDEVLGTGAHTVSNRWLVPAGEADLSSGLIDFHWGELRARIRAEGPGCRVRLHGEGRTLLGEAIPGSSEVLGWYSPTYNELEGGLTAEATFLGELPIRTQTVIVIGDGEPPTLVPSSTGSGFSLEGAAIFWKTESLRLG